MYCRKCGNKISDTDIYCQFCGASTRQTESPAAHADEAEGKEEIIFNPPYENHRLDHADRELRFAGEEAFTQEKEDLAGFLSENEMKEARRTQQNDAVKPSEEKEDDAEKPSHLKSSEFTWNVHEFPKPGGKTEEIEFNWNMEEFSQPEQQETAAASFEEELFREITEDSSLIKEKNIDRFFTFSRKNEEFQQLLDREYEKLNMQFGPETEEPTESAQEPAAEPTESTQEPEVAPAKSALEPTGPAQKQAEAPDQAEVTDHLSEMAQARTQFFGEELVRDNETIRRKLKSSEEGEEPEPDQDKTPDPEENIIPEPIEQNIIPEQVGQNIIQEHAEQQTESASAEPEEEPISEQGVGIDLAGIDLSEQEPEENAHDSVAEGVQDQPEEESRLQEDAADNSAEATAPAEETISPLSQLFAPLEDEEKEAHKIGAGQIVLTVIAIILAIEIAILGIRYLAPHSTAAKIVDNTQTQIIQTVSGWADGIKDLFSGKDANEDAVAPEDNDQNTVVDNTQNGPPAEEQDNAGTKQAVPDPNPAADKNALVTSQLGNNKNIEQVKANEALAYQQGRDYGQADVNNSKPIANNIWQTPESGTAVYYDQSVVGTVISFDSQWIDYVNGGGKGVLDLLKKDSAAYRKTASFSKIGKIKEAFKLLEIGEIRQGANGFYVWAHEELQVTENGKTAVMKYNWIYYLEPVEGKMKIVNYFKF